MNLSSEPTTLYKIMARLSNVLKWSLAIVIAMRKGPHIGLAMAPWVCIMTSMAASKRLRGSINGFTSSISRVNPFFRPCAWMIISKHIPAFAGTLNAAFWASGSEDRYCWTANCHASELDWLAGEAIPGILGKSIRGIRRSVSLLWSASSCTYQRRGRRAGTFTSKDAERSQSA